MDTVTSVVVAADGETAVSGSWDHTLRVWSLSSGLCTSLLQVSEGGKDGEGGRKGGEGSRVMAAGTTH